jgi:hypothetical protein
LKELEESAGPGICFWGCETNAESYMASIRKGGSLPQMEGKDLPKSWLESLKLKRLFPKAP